MFDPKSIETTLKSAPEIRGQLADGIAGLQDVAEQISANGLAVQQLNAEITDATLRRDDMLRAGSQLERDMTVAEARVGRIGSRLAAEISEDGKLDDVSRALFGVIYASTRVHLGPADNPNPYMPELRRGATAMSDITNRLQPAEPILHIKGGGLVFSAAAVTEEGLVGEPLNRGTGAKDLRDIPVGEHISFNRDSGRVRLALPGAMQAKPQNLGLSKISEPDRDLSITLFSRVQGEGLDHLEQAASNASWLIIGGEAIRAAINRKDEASTKLAVATVMTAAGLEVPFDLGEEIQASTADTLVNLVSFIAAGGTRETKVIAPAFRRRLQLARRGARQPRARIVDATPLWKLSQDMDLKSIKHTAKAIGLDKQELGEAVAEQLEERTSDDTTSLNQLGKDIASKEGVGKILTAIFGETE